MSDTDAQLTASLAVGHADTFQSEMLIGCSVSVNVIYRDSSMPVITELYINELVGVGTFGRVYKATMGNKMVALKQLISNNDWNKSEVQILKAIDHCNIVRLEMHCDFELESRQYMMLAYSFMPMSLGQLLEKMQPSGMNMVYVRIVSYQLFRALAYIHSLFICHRDIKPENLLIDPCTFCLKIADFGSAKYCKKDETNWMYVCSRLYRAPEIFANFDKYDESVDIWSAGCVLAELIKGSALFKSIRPDATHLQYLFEILGNPKVKKANAIYQFYKNCGLKLHKMPKQKNWSELLNRNVPNDLSDLLTQCFEFDYHLRIAPMKACAHNSYDELRTMETMRTPMPNGNVLPQLFNFSSYEMSIEPGLWPHLLPLYFPSPANDGTAECLQPFVT